MNTKNLKVRGFSLVELMIAMVMLSLIVAAVVSVVMKSQKAKRNTELVSEAQQTARILVDMISDDIRSAGYGANTVAGHTPIVYAAPFDIMISANLAPYPDDPAAPGNPLAIKPASQPLPGGASPLYNGGIGFTDGAETIRYTFDSNNDGTVTTADRGDDLEERLTRNDSLYSITRQVFGYNSVTNSNGGNPLPVGLARSNFPVRNSGAEIQPLFQYWISADGGDYLYGDTDGDGSLSEQEIANLTPVPPGDLRYISRVIITATTSTKTPNSKNVYEQVEISTTTTITRNIKITEGRIISGTVAIDGNNNQIVDSGETGIPNVRVENRTDGQVVFTDAEGNYSFSVEAKKHTIEITLPTVNCSSTIGYKAVDPAKLSYLVDAISTSVTRNFSLAQYSPGYVQGVAFIDLNEDGEQAGTGEVGISGCKVYLNTFGVTVYTDANGNYCLAAEPCSDSLKCSPVVHDPEYTPTIPSNADTFVTITAGNTATQNFGFVTAGQCTLKGKVFLDEGNGQYDGTEPGIGDVELAVYYRATAATPLIYEQYYDMTPIPKTASDGTFEIKVSALATRYYSLTEIDPKGYFSTTTNRYDIGYVTTGQVITGKNFGDKVLTAVSFSASNVLSMTVNDFREYELNMTTEYNDTDIVLGTKYETGRGNIRGWFNRRYLYSGAQTTDVGQLFDSTTASKQYVYEQNIPINVNIQAIASDTMNHLAKVKSGGITTANLRQSRHRKDLVLGLSNTSSITYNVAVWPTLDTCKPVSGFYDSIGAAVTEAAVPNAAPYIYKLIAGGNSAYPVNALAVANFGGDRFADIIAGYSSVAGTGTGGFQLWINTEKIPSTNTTSEIRTFPDSGASQRWTGIGEVMALAADSLLVGSDTKTDLVVGTRTGAFAGSIIVYAGTGVPTGTPKWFTPLVTLNPQGEVTALKIIDIDPAGIPAGKKDIVAAVRTDSIGGKPQGNLQVWLQDASGNFGKFNSTTSQWECSFFTPFYDAEPVCLDAALMKWSTSAITPHIVVGIRSSDVTGKTMIFDCSGGVLPEAGTDAAYGAYAGAVAAVKIADFNMDTRKDIAVADKTGVDQGRLIIYYAK